jgi:hypothetical protein
MIDKFALIAAATPDLEELTSGQTPSKTPMFGPMVRDISLILAAVVLLTAVLIYWAAYVRKPKGRNSRSRNASSASHEVAPRPAEKSSSSRRRRRRRRRDHRPRNPTLAETGGLPPPKSEAGQQLSD